MEDAKTSPLPRDAIGQFIGTPRGIRAFEDLQGDTTNIFDAVGNATFLVVSDEPSLGNERILTPSADFAVVDGGANGNYTLGLSDTAVVPGAYGSAAKTIAISANAKGRVTGVSAYDLNTSNITEGSNLYYTDARARAALSATAPVIYNAASGAIALAPSGVTAGTYASPTSITVDSFGRITAIA